MNRKGKRKYNADCVIQQNIFDLYTLTTTEFTTDGRKQNLDENLTFVLIVLCCCLFDYYYLGT